MNEGVTMAAIGKVTRTEEEWRKQLGPERYRILREDGTEPPFRNKYWDNHQPGTYVCGGCGNPLFSSEDKFDSGTGWPSFVSPLKEEAVVTRADRSFGMVRVAVECAVCGGHLGHVFDDGPPPNGKRFCMNSGAMDFHPR